MQKSSSIIIFLNLTLICCTLLCQNAKEERKRLRRVYILKQHIAVKIQDCSWQQFSCPYLLNTKVQFLLELNTWMLSNLTLGDWQNHSSPGKLIEDSTVMFSHFSICQSIRERQSAELANIIHDFLLQDVSKIMFSGIKTIF